VIPPVTGLTNFHSSWGVRICRPATFCENSNVRDLGDVKLRDGTDSAAVNLPEVSVASALSVPDELTLFQGTRMVNHLVEHK
jgi:hypothetical protein